MTFLLVLFAEVLPKTYSINKPTRTAIIIAPFIYYLNKFLLPFVFFINSIVNIIINKKKFTNVKISDEQSEEELTGVIDLYKTSSPDSEHEKEMLQSILTLNDTTVEEVFTHRKNIFSINADLDLKIIIDHINKSNFTRIPFWQNNPENIIGLLDKRTLNIDINKSKEILEHLNLYEDSLEEQLKEIKKIFNYSKQNINILKNKQNIKIEKIGSYNFIYLLATKYPSNSLK